MTMFANLYHIVRDCDFNPKDMLVTSACIELKRPLPSIFFKKIKNSDRFQCMDITYGCFNEYDQNHEYFSGSCVDSKYGTIFGIDVNFERIVLVPKHRVKQETFVDFFLWVRKIDRSVRLTTFSEWAKRSDDEIVQESGSQ